MVVVERRVRGLGPERGEGGEGGQVVAHHGEPAEPADVAEREVGAVVEPPPRSDVGVEVGLAAVDEPARHAEVGHEAAAVVERQQQVLPPSADPVDARPDDVARGDELRRGVAVDLEDPAADHQRRQPTAHRLDLRQLGHPGTVLLPGRHLDAMSGDPRRFGHGGW
ncbi:MAG: hypothetical protein R2702_18465 [Acidimicrobiales bacterium]